MLCAITFSYAQTSVLLLLLVFPVGLAISQNTYVFAAGDAGSPTFAAFLSLFLVQVLTLLIAAAISALQASKARIAEALVLAQKASQAKTSFLATMSHEIRTPLNALIGTAYLLGHSKLNTKQRTDLRTMEVASKSLLALINDILDFSKIEAGELEVDPQTFSLPETLTDLKMMFTALAAKKGVKLTIGAAAGIEPMLIGDVTRLQQCLINLLGNAVKFTEQGTVTLTVAPVSAPEAAPLRLRFTVTDTGPGMTPAQMGVIFTPFTQGDSSTSRSFGGTGLGLSIVKRLAEVMGGAVGVHSELGQGSQFWLELPFTVSPHASPIGVTEGVRRPLHVLVADDDAADREVFVHMAQGFGWNVEGAESGMTMIERVLERQAEGHAIDCIILDWRMPGLDGLAALSDLKLRLGGSLMPSVIMVTAADKDALFKSMQADRPDSVLTKPVAPSALFNAVNEAAVAHGARLDQILEFSDVGNEYTRWLPGVRVLVTDDSRLNLSVIGRVLEREGALPVLCESGQEALDTLLAKPKSVDLVLMDLQMPVLDGFETTMHIRRNPDLTGLPVLALTAGATATERQRALDAGMNDFLTKPVNPARLVRTVRLWVERYRGEPLTVRPSEPSPLPGAQDGLAPYSDDAGNWPAFAGFDRRAAQSALGDDVDFFRELLGPFLAQNAGFVTEVRALLDDGQLEQAARIAHKLRSQAGNLGLTALQQAVGQLEDGLRDGKAPTAPMFDKLATIHAGVFHAAQQWLDAIEAMTGISPHE